MDILLRVNLLSYWSTRWQWSQLADALNIPHHIFRQLPTVLLQLRQQHMLDAHDVDIRERLHLLRSVCKNNDVESWHHRMNTVACRCLMPLYQATSCCKSFWVKGSLCRCWCSCCRKAGCASATTTVSGRQSQSVRWLQVQVSHDIQPPAHLYICLQCLRCWKLCWTKAFWTKLILLILSVSDFPLSAPTTSSVSVDSPLLPSITPSLFHCRLKTYLFHKSFPP